MKSFRELLFESDVADQAHQMGLKFAGWGKWKDSSGKVTHKSVGGKLVPVGGGAAGAAATPKTEPSAPKTPAAPKVSAKLPKDPRQLGMPVDFENTPRPKKMKAIKPNGHLQSQDKTVDYGHAGQIFKDKYGAEGGEKAYERLFVNANNNFGWSVASNIQKEKRAMIDALGMDQPHDLDDVAYFPLWQAWQKKEGISQTEEEPQAAAAKNAPAPKPAAAAPTAPEPKLAPKTEPKSEPPQSKTKSDVFTSDKLSNFYQKVNEIAQLTSKLEALNKEVGESTQEMLDEFDRTNSKTAEVENFIARKARSQSLKTTQSYQTGYNFLLDKVNEELKRSAEAALKATEKISYVRGKVDVTKKEPMQEESDQKIQQISTQAAAQMKQSNDNIDNLMMLLQLLSGGGGKAEEAIDWNTVNARLQSGKPKPKPNMGSLKNPNWKEVNRRLQKS